MTVRDKKRIWHHSFCKIWAEIITTVSFLIKKMKKFENVANSLFVCLFVGFLDAISKSLILSDRKVFASRILSLNASSGLVITAVTWRRPSTLKGSDSLTLLEINGPVRVTEEDPKPGIKPDRFYPWYEDSESSPLRSPKFMTSPANVSFKGWWTFPYYSCLAKKWLMSYSVPVPPTGRHA